MISDLAILIQETVFEIKEAEKLVYADPTDFFALSALKSLEKRLDSLHLQFDAAAGDAQLEVLRYKLLSAPSQVSLRAVNDLLATFQQAFTIVYDALRNGTAKKRARANESSIDESTLRFAYSFPGSVGFALTLPRELTLLNHDHYGTLALMRELSAAADEAEVKAFASTYGLGAVRTLYKWFDAISKNGVDSQLDWYGIDSRATFVIQVADARAIRTLISGVHDIEYTERSFRGSLVAYDSVRRTFRFAVANRTIIHGTVSDRLTEQLKVPAPYNVLLRVAVISKYSSEDKEEKFELLSASV